MAQRTLLQTLFIVAVVVGLTLFIPDTSWAAAKKYKLRGARLTTVSVNGVSRYCGMLPNRRDGFVPVRSVGAGQFVEVSRNRNRAHTNACKYARRGNNLTSVSLTQLPSSSTLVRQAASSNSISAVSGTPPLISELRETDISSIFWREGVVSSIASGTPTQDQCNEFWGSNSVDGVSSGFSGCYLAQNVGESLQHVLQAGTNLCYMRNIPTNANYSAGAIQLNSGTLPTGGISQIFTTPISSTSRIVRITAPEGETSSNIFLRIYSSGENSITGDRYRANLWFCDPGQDSPQEVVLIRFSLSDQFSVTSWNRSMEDPAGTGFGEVQGYLTPSGSSYAFDTSRVRSADAKFITDDLSIVFASSMTIGGDNVIRSKVHSLFGSSENRKAYSLMQFSGATASNLRFIAGAYKDSFIQNAQTISNTIGTEFREPTYLSAPTVSLIEDLSDVDLDSDPFFTTTPAISFDISPYSCSAVANVVLTMNTSHPNVALIQSQCEEEQLRDMNFCSSDASIRSAQERWFSVCAAS